MASANPDHTLQRIYLNFGPVNYPDEGLNTHVGNTVQFSDRVPGVQFLPNPHGPSLVVQFPQLVLYNCNRFLSCSFATRTVVRSVLTSPMVCAFLSSSLVYFLAGLWIRNDLTWIRILLFRSFRIRILPFKPGQLNHQQILCVLYIKGLLQNFSRFFKEMCTESNTIQTIFKKKMQKYTDFNVKQVRYGSGTLI